MWFPGRIRHIAAVDIQPALHALNRLDESVWFADDETKKYLAGDRPTQSLFFYSMTKEDYVRTLAERPIQQSDVRKLQAFDILYSDFAYLFDLVQDYYPRGGVFLRAQIARMPPGGTIAEHRDSLMILENSHRLHIPIVTTSKLKFVVDDERVSLKAGQLYELNNQLRHWVKNPVKSINRIHLILDYLPPEYNVPASTDENFKFYIREHRIGRKPKPSDLSLDQPSALAVVGSLRSPSRDELSLHLVDFKKKQVDKVFDLSNLENQCSASNDLNFPCRVAVANNAVVIARGSSLHLLDKDFNYQESFSSAFLNPVSALAGKDGYLYAASYNSDVIVRFDVNKKIFDIAWEFYVDESKKIAVRTLKVDDNISARKQAPVLGIQCLEAIDNQLVICCDKQENLIVLENDNLQAGSQLPRDTVDFVSYRKGAVFLSQAMHRVVYMTDHDYRAVNSSALQASFAGGLCRYLKGTILAGTQPAGVAWLDMKSQSLLNELTISEADASTVFDVALFN